jgi:hypothetical protein
MFSERKAKRGQTRVFVICNARNGLAKVAKKDSSADIPSIGPPVADAVEQSFLGALKHCANGVIVFPILGHLSTRPGHASGFQRQNQQNFDLAGC